jgi:acyl-CoA synthetase (AMP-forming)/AMP-acid ligase II
MAVRLLTIAMRTNELLYQSDFTPMGELIRGRASEQGDRPALLDGAGSLTWRELDALVDRIAARLQADGIGRGDTVAIAGYNAIPYALALFAALRIGAAAALLTVSATADALIAMLADSGARHLFLDRALAERLAPLPSEIDPIGFDELSAWMAPTGASPAPVAVQPEDPFNIIYSSGTTGQPKGIVQSHAMRMAHLRRAEASGYDPSATALISTPLYSNTTLVSFLPAIAGGSRVVLMPRFEARRFCEIAEAEKATHAMLVPVQYQRLMALADFDDFDLSAFRFKSCTSAPFPAELKAEVLRRWPGRLVEFYGMTEGGASCILDAGAYPDKLHTVGRPAEGHELLLLDEAGREVPPGEDGEIVGRSPAMMTGYHGLPGKTREAEWYDARGRRFIRHGDLGRLDADGFLILIGRQKDLIISGGFNIYPADLEAELLRHPAVADAAVVAAPSEQWGETPIGFVVLRDGTADPDAILAEANSRLGRTQRISALHALGELPRSAIGKVLKRELREMLTRS